MPQSRFELHLPPPVLVANRVAPALLAIILGSCGLGPTYDVVTGTFDGSKLIALSKWVGTNTNACCTNIDAYADVADQTAGMLDISGPQHWRCEGLFRVQSDVPTAGGLFESDQDRRRDKALSLPKLAGGFAGPPNRYRVTIEVPSVGAKFSHTWSLPGFVYPPAAYNIYDNSSSCTPIADTLAQQRSIADQYLSALQARLNQLDPMPLRTQLQASLDQARKAKSSGDGEPDPDQRKVDYQSAMASLTTMVQVAGDTVPRWDGSRWIPLSMGDVDNIKKFANKAGAILSETGLA